MTFLPLLAFWTTFKFVLCILIAILWGGIMGMGTTCSPKQKDNSNRTN